MKQTAKYYLGIDGGGTKTRFALVTANGGSVRTVTLGASNPIDLGIRGCLGVLSAGIEQVCGNIPYAEISVFAGISGGVSGDSKAQIGEFLAEYGFAKYDNGSDSENIMAAGLKERDGVVVIMGTGSCAFVKKGNGSIRIGGMGYLFDFGGSGYDVGAQGIAAALGAEDGTGRATKIRDGILKRTGKATVLESLGEFYAGGKREIASYAPLVFEAYDDGDEQAKEILQANMKRVAVLIHASGKHFTEKEVEVQFVGGLTKRFEILRPYIEAELARLGDKKHYRFGILEKDVVIGALYKAGLSKEVEIC